MSDPYMVLGISRDADMDEVKKAYRNLSRKYHPDANINNPNKEKAEEMFKLIQEAYRQILDERERGSAYSYGSGGTGQDGGYGGFGGFEGFETGGRRSGPDLAEPRMRAAANYINGGYYREAMHVLEDLTSRTASWYYLRALACAGLGRDLDARADIRTAVTMEPDNYEFRLMERRLTQGESWYQEMGQGYGYGEPCGSASGGCLNCCTMSLCLSCCCPSGGIFCC